MITKPQSTSAFIKILKPVISGLLQITVIVLAIVWLLNSGADAMNYNWQWYRVPQYLFFKEDGEWFSAELIDGLLITIKISAISLIFTIIFGLVTAPLR